MIEEDHIKMTIQWLMCPIDVVIRNDEEVRLFLLSRRGPYDIYVPHSKRSRLVQRGSAPLYSRRLIPLPSLYDGTIRIHSLLSYRHPLPAIAYDMSLSPRTAKLSLSADQNELPDWKDYPAMDPLEITSLTIRLAGVLRPIVVFPRTLDAEYVKIGDVLEAVYSKVELESMDDASAMGFYSGCEDNSVLRRAIYARLEGRCIWGGLYPDAQEPDVWILRTEISNTIDWSVRFPYI